MSFEEPRRDRVVISVRLEPVEVHDTDIGLWSPSKEQPPSRRDVLPDALNVPACGGGLERSPPASVDELEAGRTGEDRMGVEVDDGLAFDKLARLGEIELVNGGSQLDAGG